MITILNNISIVLSICFISTFILFGWGNLTSRAIGLTNPNKLFSTQLLIGLVSVSIFIEACHFFVPIDWRLTTVVAIFGILSLNYSSLLNYVNLFKSFLKKKPFVSFFSLLILFYWSLRVIQVPTNADTAGYHLQTIRWLNQYPIIPGIANLSFHYGFNQSYFEFLALLKTFPYFNKGFELGGMIFFLITSLTLLERSSKKYIGFAFFAFLLYLIAHSAGSTLFSPTPDLIIAFVEVIIFSILIDYTFNIKDKNSQKESVILLLALSTYLFTIKLSSLFFSIGVFLIVIQKITLKDKLFLRAILFCLSFIVIHFISGYILSGSPLFPNTIGSLQNLPWAVPSEQAKIFTQIIYSWPRNPYLPSEQVLQNFDWVSFWIKRMPVRNLIYLLTAILLLLVNLYLVIKYKNKIADKFKIGILFLPVLGSIIFWFLTAPDFRFLGASLEIFIALCILYFSHLTSFLRDKIRKIFEVNNFIRYMLIILMTQILLSLHHGVNTEWKDIPVVATYKIINKSGLTINIPINSLCWDSDLPCINGDQVNGDVRATSSLHLIKDGDLSSGFSVK